MLRTSDTTRYDYVPTGKIWPSGDFSCGRARIDWAGPVPRDRRSLQRAYDESQDGRWTAAAIQQRKDYGSRPGGWVEALEAEGFYENASGMQDGGDSPLTLATVPNSHKPSNRPERYGRKGITGYGRKMVKSACKLLESHPGRRLTFATVTMPSLSQPLRRELASAWPEMIRQALQWLSRRLKREGLRPLVVSVTEIQPGRLEEYREGYLHLHLVWPNHWAKAGNWAIDVDEFRAWVSEFLQRRGLWESDSWVRVNVQRVRKSAGAYLSKYMSKGSAEIEAFAEDCGWESVPSQWWNMTKPARDWVKENLLSGVAVGRVLEAAVDYVLSTGAIDGLWCLTQVTREWEGRVIPCGWVGVLKAGYLADLSSLVKGA